MSRIYENGYRIVYPNELAYAGMPAIVRVSNLDASYLGVGLTIQVGEAYYTETRTPYNGEVVFDISRYMQLAFVGKSLGVKYGDNRYTQAVSSPTQAVVGVVVMLTDTAGTSTNALSFDLNALFGYINIGRANGGGVRGRRWFVNFPQTFDFYGEGYNMDIYIEGASGEYHQVDIDTEEADALRQISVEVSPFWNEVFRDSEEKEATLHADGAAYINGDEFVNDDSTTYRLAIDRCTKGVYLRWLDNFGQWCYYLFRVTGRNYTTKETQSWQDGILRNELKDEGGVFLASGQTHQQMSQQESISLGAKLVDAETFDFLLTLANSPMVEVLVNASEYLEAAGTTPYWERVSVVAGSYARTGAPLQDFVVSIARAAHKSQAVW